MIRILTVAQNTFREAMRDKVLHVLLGFAGFSILASKALGWISIGQDLKIIKDITLASASLFGVLIAIFVGTSLIYKEMDKRTLYTILAQPMRRWEFVLGKYMGLAGLLGVVVAVMGIVSAVYILLMGGRLDGVYFIALLLILVKLLLVTAFAILLSAMSTPILGAVIVFVVYVFGHATGVFRDLPPQFEGTFAKTLLENLYYVLPNLSNFDLRAEAANGVPVNPWYVAYAIVYGACYTAALLLLAVLAFERKDV